MSHGAFRILLSYRGENSPGLFIKERVQQRHAANEFRSRGGRARYGEIHFPGHAQIARFRDN